MPDSPRSPIVVIAPNVGEQMGGEALKALQIYRELKVLRPDTLLVTHHRNRAEVERLGLLDVHLVEDSALSIFFWKSVVLRYLVDVWFGWKAVRMAEQLTSSSERAILYQAEPNSPVLPRVTSARHLNIFGPINGNIYYPRPFRAEERLSARLRRTLHLPLQRLSKIVWNGLQRADLILTAGGRRTRESLTTAGCAPGQLLDSVDCGIDDRLLERPRIQHQGFNPRFVHFGRLVFHKCTFLIIESLPRTRNRICLDVIGSGPELERCKALVARLELHDRVSFRPPYSSQADLFDALEQYRALVLPSIEDANGMVVQESMALGLPAVCLDWGGPQLLIEHQTTGFLIEPRSREQIVEEMAACLDRLATDDGLAEAFSVAGRRRAEHWRWSKVATEWLAAFDRVAQARPRPA